MMCTEVTGFIMDCLMHLDTPCPVRYEIYIFYDIIEIQCFPNKQLAPISPNLQFHYWPWHELPVKMGQTDTCISFHISVFSCVNFTFTSV